MDGCELLDRELRKMDMTKLLSIFYVEIYEEYFPLLKAEIEKEEEAGIVSKEMVEKIAKPKDIEFPQKFVENVRESYEMQFQWSWPMSSRISWTGMGRQISRLETHGITCHAVCDGRSTNSRSWSKSQIERKYALILAWNSSLCLWACHARRENGSGSNWCWNSSQTSQENGERDPRRPKKSHPWGTIEIQAIASSWIMCPS